jgi:hypothetical protein
MLFVCRRLPANKKKYSSPCSLCVKKYYQHIHDQNPNGNAAISNKRHEILQLIFLARLGYYKIIIYYLSSRGACTDIVRHSCEDRSPENSVYNLVIVWSLLHKDRKGQHSIFG